MRWDSVLVKNVPRDTKRLAFAKQLVKNSPVGRTRKGTRTSDKTLTRLASFSPASEAGLSGFSFFHFQQVNL